jgi:hypothetical protein
MVRSDQLIHGIVGTLRNYAKAPHKDVEGYQRYCRAYPETWNKIIKECKDAEEKNRNQEEKA